MKKIAGVYGIVWMLVSIVTCAGATEYRFGPGHFKWRMSMPFLNCDFTLRTQVFSITAPHENIAQSRFFYYYNVDIYRSDFMDKVTTAVALPVTHDFPFIGSFSDAFARYSGLPTPAEYKVRGVDLNLGLGYDIVHNEKGFVGVGINTGLSMPMIKMKDMVQSARLTYSLLKRTQTDILTYKIGPIVTAQYNITPKLNLYGSFTFGYQKGTIDNDWVASSFDVEGRYSALDLGIRYKPIDERIKIGWLTLTPQLFFTAGYVHKHWKSDDIRIDAFNIAEMNFGGIVKNRFDSDYFYLGVGYRF